MSGDTGMLASCHGSVWSLLNCFRDHVDRRGPSMRGFPPPTSWEIVHRYGVRAQSQQKQVRYPKMLVRACRRAA